MTNSQTLSTTNRVDTKLEVVVVPVADVARSKNFYTALGWRLDADFANGDWRIVQVTPPGSACSVIFGHGVTNAPPGSAQGLYLVVDDVEAARGALAAGGADISEVFHFAGPVHVTGTEGRVPGRHPQGDSYRSFAAFSDPDGNGFIVQEVRTRLPGRGMSRDVATLTELLKDAEQRHGDYEPTAPKHHWSTWYGAYIVARERGATPEEAAAQAAEHVDASRR